MVNTRSLLPGVTGETSVTPKYIEKRIPRSSENFRGPNPNDELHPDIATEYKKLVRLKKRPLKNHHLNSNNIRSFVSFVILLSFCRLCRRTWTTEARRIPAAWPERGPGGWNSCAFRMMIRLPSHVVNTCFFWNLWGEICFQILNTGCEFSTFEAACGSTDVARRWQWAKNMGYSRLPPFRGSTMFEKTHKTNDGSTARDLYLSVCPDFLHRSPTSPMPQRFSGCVGGEGRGWGQVEGRTHPTNQ